MSNSFSYQLMYTILYTTSILDSRFVSLCMHTVTTYLPTYLITILLFILVKYVTLEAVTCVYHNHSHTRITNLLPGDLDQVCG